MKAHLLLADAAQTDSIGKVHALGLGWTVTTTPTPPQAVIAIFDLDWHEANQPFHFEIKLLNADGSQIFGPGPAGPAPIQIEGDLETGRPPGLPQGSNLMVPVTVNIAPGLPLQVGQRYEWRLHVDSKIDESAGFAIIGANGSPPAE